MTLLREYSDGGEWEEGNKDDREGGGTIYALFFYMPRGERMVRPGDVKQSNDKNLYMKMI
jgi:hypothetical protein